MFISQKTNACTSCTPESPAFWTKLDDERKALCRHLDTEGNCADLVERLSHCPQHACGLAACPVCLAHADQIMFECMHDMCDQANETVFFFNALNFGFLSDLPGVEDIPSYLKKLGEQIAFNETDVDAYIGRFICKPLVWERTSRSRPRKGYLSGFMGAMRMTNFLIRSKDDLSHAVLSPVSTNVEQINAKTNFYNDRVQFVLDRNSAPYQRRQSRSRPRSEQARDETAKLEVTLAKALGSKKCDYLSLCHLGKH